MGIGRVLRPLPLSCDQKNRFQRPIPRLRIGAFNRSHINGSVFGSESFHEPVAILWLGLTGILQSREVGRRMQVPAWREGF